MRVALSEWEGRISPVFDTCSKLLVVACEDGRESTRTVEQLDPRDPCCGRRPGEPRRVLGRPRTDDSGPGKPPEPVEITTAAASTATLYPREDWREQFAAAVKRALPDLTDRKG